MLCLSYLQITAVWDFIKENILCSNPPSTKFIFSSIHLPKDIVQIIFSHLSPKDLVRISAVCKIWQQFAYDRSLWSSKKLKELFSSLEIFDTSFWNAHFLIDHVKHDAYLSQMRKTVAILGSQFSSIKEKKDLKIALVTMPKGYSLNRLLEISEQPISGQATKFDYPWLYLSEKTREKEITETCTAIISFHALTSDIHIDPLRKKRLIEKFNCRLPEALPALTLAVFQNLNLQNRLMKRIYVGTVKKINHDKNSQDDLYALNTNIMYIESRPEPEHTTQCYHDHGYIEKVLGEEMYDDYRQALLSHGGTYRDCYVLDGTIP